MQILLVDDSKEIRELLRATIRSGWTDIEVLEAGTLDDALSILRAAEGIEGVVCDGSFPAADEHGKTDEAMWGAVWIAAKLRGLRFALLTGDLLLGVRASGNFRPDDLSQVFLKPDGARLALEHVLGPSRSRG